MKSELFSYLKHEQILLERLNQLSAEMQTALSKLDAVEIERTALEQNEVSKSLRAAEEMRIRLIMSETGMPRRQASSIKLSGLKDFLDSDEIDALMAMRRTLKSNLIKLHNSNSINRMLSTRALKSARELLAIITRTQNGHTLCNAKI